MDLAHCIGISFTTEAPVSGSVDQFLSKPENFDKIFGEPDPNDKYVYITPARRAFEFMNVQTHNLTSLEKSQIWTGIASELHRRYPQWESVGPYRSSDGAYIFQGGLGYILVIRQRDGAMFTGRLKYGPPKPSWIPTYRDLTPLNTFLETNQKAREKKALEDSP